MNKRPATLILAVVLAAQVQAPAPAAILKAQPSSAVPMAACSSGIRSACATRWRLSCLRTAPPADGQRRQPPQSKRS